MTAQHAIYAPSSGDRWTVCTASAEAIAQLPEQEEGEAAREGTEAHSEIERILGEFNDGRRSDTRWAYEPDTDHPAAYGIALFLDYVRQLPPGSLYVEQRVELTRDIWGRCDVAHFDPASETLTIVDYKNGYVGVDAEENAQIRIYAAASIYTHNLAPKFIRYAIVQPNDFRPVPRVKQWAESVESLNAFVSTIVGIPKGPKQFVAGEHCRYCPLFGRCEPTRDILAHLAIALQHTPDEVSPAQRALFKMMAKPIEDWFKNADKTWMKDALANGAPAGMKLVTSKTNREWIDEAASRAAVVAKLGVEALSPPTVAQAEKMGLDVEALSRKPDGGPVLALESDKRAPWVRKSAEEMFAGVVSK